MLRPIMVRERNLTGRSGRVGEPAVDGEATFQGVQRIERVIQSVLFLDVISRDLVQMSGALHDSALGLGDKRRNALFVAFQQRGDVDILPS
jgi:hypothetical protein